MSAESKDIMNAQLELPGGALLYLGDLSPQYPYEGMKGVLNYDTVDEAETVFNALARGGEVTMPFQRHFLGEEIRHGERPVRYCMAG